MKPLELTEEHKIKLLEMFRELFPEYTRIEFYEIYNIEFEINNTSNTIHWFEFCLLHLSEKIYKTFSKITEEDNWYGSHLNWAINTMYTKKPHKIHLIDYLYEEFKKLK